MKKEPTLLILKGGGHTMGTYKKPIKPTEGKEPQTEEPQVNDEEPMLPVILDDTDTDKKKKPTGTENEDILMPPSL